MLSGYIAGAIMKQEVILVLDCGATNVRAIAVNRQGKIVARADGKQHLAPVVFRRHFATLC